jgi:hypothetical protein
MFYNHILIHSLVRFTKKKIKTFRIIFFHFSREYRYKENIHIYIYIYIYIYNVV